MNVTTDLMHHSPSPGGSGAPPTNRLAQIRAEVAISGSNLENAYADRAWLLQQLDEAVSCLQNLLTGADEEKWGIWEMEAERLIEKHKPK